MKEVPPRRTVQRNARNGGKVNARAEVNLLSGAAKRRERAIRLTENGSPIAVPRGGKRLSRPSHRSTIAKEAEMGHGAIWRSPSGAPQITALCARYPTFSLPVSSRYRTHPYKKRRLMLFFASLIKIGKKARRDTVCLMFFAKLGTTLRKHLKGGPQKCVWD